MRKFLIRLTLLLWAAFLGLIIGYQKGKHAADKWYDNHTLILLHKDFKGPFSMSYIQSSKMQCILGVTSDYASTRIVFVRKIEVE